MAIRVVQSHDGWYVQDDRHHLYLDPDGRWRTVPWYFASAQEANEALRVKNGRNEFAIQ